MLERHALEPRRDREAEQARLLREQLRGHLDHRVALRVVDAVLDRAPVVLGDVAPVEQAIDEGAQPLLGGHAARRRVRLLDQAERAELGQRGADRRRGELLQQQVGDVLRADRRGLAHVGADRRAQHVLLALREPDRFAESAVLITGPYLGTAPS